MRKISGKLLALAGALAVFASLQARAQEAVPTSSIPADIQAQIQARAEQLKQVNEELEKTQGQLNVVKNQKSTLQGQVQALDTSIKQLNLTIRSDQLTSENLADEITALQGNLQEIDAGIQKRRQAIAATFQELQKDDATPLVVMLLSGRSLAEGLSEAHSLGSLRTQLSADVSTLNQLADRYNSTLASVSSKRNQVAVKLENLSNRKAIVQDEQATRATLLKETKNQESLYQQKVSQLKAQQTALDNEIERIEAELRARLNPSVLPPQQAGLFSWPFESVRVTQNFGERSSLYSGKPHNGIDLGAPIGTPVLAAADGVVTAVGNNDRSATLRYQYGRHIMIKHGNNLSTLYAHLSRQVVAPGQSVKRGEVIGYSGNSGYSTGPHLHFGVYYTPTVEFKSLPPAAGAVPVGVVLNGRSFLP